MSTALMSPALLDCYHCGEPIPKGFTLQVKIENIDQSMCCHGCAAVAETIVK